MPALFPRLSEDALIPSKPSHRRRQRFVICLATRLISGESASLASTVPDVADTAEVNDPDLIMSAAREGPLSSSSGWQAFILLACLLPAAGAY